MTKLEKLVKAVEDLLSDAEGSLADTQRVALYMQAMNTAVGNAQAMEFARIQQDEQTAETFEKAVKAVFDGVRTNPV